MGATIVVVDVEAGGATRSTGWIAEFAVGHLQTGATFYGHLCAARPRPDDSAIPQPVLDDDGKDPRNGAAVPDHPALVAAPARCRSATIRPTTRCG